MMKHKLLFLMLTLLPTCANADIISRDAAAQRAADYLEGITSNRRLTAVENGARLAPPRRGTVSAPAYYVFSRGKGQGYVIVSADDQTDAVLGYTDSGDFDYASLPGNMRAWLDDCEAQLMDLRRVSQTDASGRAHAPKRVGAVPTHPAIPMLLTCRWNQGAPYNNECPLYTDGRRCVTGCVATAMAQIMYHQRAKSVDKTTAAIPSYNTGEIAVKGIAKGAPLDWANMRDDGGSTTAQKLAVAQLMHYCGVSVEMGYTSGSSGAYSSKVGEALKKYFGYGSSVQYVGRYAYTNVTWDALIYNELAHGNPVYLSGANSEAGHAFVCDGYDGKRNFHINWGWGGQSDGFYLLNKLTPGSQGIGGSNDGYNDYQEAVIGIVPANYSKKAIPFSDVTLKRLCVASWDTDGDGELSYGEASKVKDLGTTFKGTRIKSFGELSDFTAITAIADDAFSGCSQLTSLTLPEKVKSIGSRAFSGCRALTNILLPDGVTAIGDSAFAGCRVLTSVGIPDIAVISPHTFEACAALKAIEVPSTVTAIGDMAFAGCAKLQTFTLTGTDPTAMTFGEAMFDGVDVSQVTLNVPAGTRAFYASHPQWSAFGNFYEVRQTPDDQYVGLTERRQVYLYNVGAQAYLTKGEAWGTQAVVGSEPMRYELRRDDSMPEGQYYLYSIDTGNNSRHILFRTMSDDKVGSGVKCCFVDGSLSENAYWVIEDVGNGCYRLSVPQGKTGYTKNCYLGILPSHKTNARPANVTTTMGAYFDVNYNSHEANCQWKFVDVDATFGTYNAAIELQNLLAHAKSKRINYEREQEILDDLTSTKAQLVSAQRTLRKKLGFVHIDDEIAKEIINANFDVNGDGELAVTEARLIDNLSTLFYGTEVEDLSVAGNFTSLQYLYGNSFEGCADLKKIELPESVTTMYYRVFYGCTSLTEITLPRYIGLIGANNFDGCTALRTVRMLNPYPGRVTLGEDVFKGVNLTEATLYVPQGCRDAYASAPVWKDFGTILEMRAPTLPDFAPLTEDEDVYIYNVASMRSITRGEAYGTQAVVANSGLTYRLRRTKTMPAGTYYMEAQVSGNKILFRTDTDSKVGSGVKACFVDGTLSNKAWWKVEPVEGKENVYTLRVPDGQAGYVEGQYLGIDNSHATDAVDDGSPTWGLYWDIVCGDDNATSCQWAFVRKADVDSLETIQAAFRELATLISRGNARHIDTSAAQAIYDNFGATAGQVADAIAALRRQLGYIDFADNHVKQVCVSRFDLDEDEELSTDEAAAASTLGQTFKLNSTLTSFDELRHFTGLTVIDADAFRSCTNLTSITIPANVTVLGKDAFAGCSKLTFMRILNPGTTPLDNSESAIGEQTNIFVEASAVAGYENSESWHPYTVSAYTGTPIVTAHRCERYYGRVNPTFHMAVLGAPVEGQPKLTCDADQRSAVGDYVIRVERGTVPEGIELRDGTLTVAPAPLTIKARSYSRNIGEQNPVFEVEYTGFRNRENAETALSQQPVVSCEATADSPAGEYAIIVSGAEAANYAITYEAGVLTVIDPVGITAPKAGMTSAEIEAIFAPDGKRRNTLAPGINILRMADGTTRKVVVKPVR